MSYAPTRASLATHPVPAWFHDAKFGIFIHWGLFSVPGWAPAVGEVQQVIAEKGWEYWFTHNAYAEWYLNTLRIPGSPTAEYHARTYGADASYDDFVPRFNAGARQWDPAAWADLFARAGARYVVLVTKHHDGFTLWPSQQPNPFKPNYAAERDIVGELSTAVRARGLRMGLYYSGGLDWTFNPGVIRNLQGLVDDIPQTPEYVAYADGHWRELIERYQPAVMWNDIGYPRRSDLPRLFAEYYAAVPEGVINDRFAQHGSGSSAIARLLQTRLGKALMKLAARRQPKPTEKPKLPGVPHYDFTTPEYARYEQITTYKWEATRGLGFSFGYNSQEGADKLLSERELIHSLIDIVSKNGNLLLNVGPMADGTIPALQVERLLALGRWLEDNGEAVYNTRPWRVAQGKTDAGLEVRFTRGADALYAILLGRPTARELTLRGLAPQPDTRVSLLGYKGELSCETDAGGLRVSLPPDLPAAEAVTLKLTPLPA